MSTVLEVIKKTIDYKNHKINIECYDTRYQSLIKQIKELSGINLSDNLNKKYFSDSLCKNIQYRQESIDNSLNSYEAYIIGLGYTLDPSNYLKIPDSVILNGESIDFDLLERIVDNEKDFYQRIRNIRQVELDNNIKFLKPNTKVFNIILNNVFSKEMSYNISKLNYYGTMRNHQYILSNMPTDLVLTNNLSWDYIDYKVLNDVDRFNYKNELGNLLKKEVFKIE